MSSEFHIDIPQQILDDLQARLRQTRWADELDDGWTFGTNRAELERLVNYWVSNFDWRRRNEN